MSRLFSLNSGLRKMMFRTSRKGTNGVVESRIRFTGPGLVPKVDDNIGTRGWSTALVVQSELELPWSPPTLSDVGVCLN